MTIGQRMGINKNFDILDADSLANELGSEVKSVRAVLDVLQQFFLDINRIADGVTPVEHAKDLKETRL